MSIHVLQQKDSTHIPVSPIPVKHTTQQYLTITGCITEFRYNQVFEQLTIELGITGSRYEFWSRRPFTIKRFLSWYQLDTGLVRIGTKISIDVSKTLEITGFR